MFQKKRKTIYMDYAAGAPLLSEAALVMTKIQKSAANPSALYKAGVLASRSLEESRMLVAKELLAHPSEIIWVSSGTESINLALQGVIRAAKKTVAAPHIVTTVIEHPAVLETCHALEQDGARVTYLSVNEQGQINLSELKQALIPDTVLVTIGYANSEIGTLQPIREIAKVIRHFKKLQSTQYPLFHTDACQAVGYENITVEQLGVDLLSFNGTKLGGPQGTGALYMRRGTPLAPLLYGGGQEKGMRSGTENIAGVGGLAAAFVKMRADMGKKENLTDLRNFFIKEITSRFPEARINGDRSMRLPNNVHVSFPSIQSELLVLELDARGVAASAGSACASAKDSGSHVLVALYGESDAKKWGSVRFSFGYATTEKEISDVLVALAAIRAKYEGLVK